MRQKDIQKIRKKKGELTTAQLVTIIILIVSFVIILFLFFRLDLGRTTNEEICHNSVVLKGKTGTTLDCKTNYVCISGGGNCDLPTSETVKVDPKSQTQIMKALADLMSSCWYEFGEGQIDYFGSPGATTNMMCGICSIVEFDGTVQNSQKNTISYNVFYDYLRDTQKTTSQTYLQYLYSTSSVAPFSQGFTLNGYLDNNIDFGQQYSILTGASREGFLSTTFNPFSTSFWPSKATPFPVVILEKTTENYNAVGCDEFVTKA